jgi:hypothetical protein
LADYSVGIPVGELVGGVAGVQVVEPVDGFDEPVCSGVGVGVGE